MKSIIWPICYESWLRLAWLLLFYWMLKLHNSSFILPQFVDPYACECHWSLVSEFHHLPVYSFDKNKERYVYVSIFDLLMHDIMSIFKDWSIKTKCLLLNRRFGSGQCWNNPALCDGMWHQEPKDRPVMSDLCPKAHLPWSHFCRKYSSM